VSGLVGDAAQLIQYALDPKMFTDRSEDYRALTQRYRTDLTFQDTVDAIVQGFRMEVVDANEWGLVLGARPGSPFAYSMGDWRRRHNVGYEGRLLHGLAIAAIAACYYPTARALEEDHHRPLTVDHVETFLRSACEELRRRHGDEPPASEQPEYEQAWRIVARQKSVSSSTASRASEKATTDVIRRCFELLADRGLVKKMKGQEAWQPLQRFRANMLGIASHYAYTELGEIRARQEGDGAGV
jgi:hypothetical protein